MHVCACLHKHVCVCTHVHAGETTQCPSLLQGDSWPRTQEVLSPRHTRGMSWWPVPSRYGGVDGDSLPRVGGAGQVASSCQKRRRLPGTWHPPS